VNFAVGGERKHSSANIRSKGFQNLSVAAIRPIQSIHWVEIIPISTWRRWRREKTRGRGE